MATVSVIKQTETLAVVKVTGADSAGVINLVTTLLSPTMVISGTPTVDIGHVFWVCGTAASSVTITRNLVDVFSAFQSGEMDFAGSGGFNETTEHTSNITVTIVGTGTVYLTLRKAAGYASKIQPWKYGSYDDETSVDA